VGAQIEKIMHGAYFRTLSASDQRDRGDTDEGIAASSPAQVSIPTFST
jgi:hypothetical protein